MATQNTLKLLKTLWIKLSLNKTKEEFDFFTIVSFMCMYASIRGRMMLFSVKK
jgi:hypothetical protein